MNQRAQNHEFEHNRIRNLEATWITIGIWVWSSWWVLGTHIWAEVVICIWYEMEVRRTGLVWTKIHCDCWFWAQFWCAIDISIDEWELNVSFSVPWFYAFDILLALTSTLLQSAVGNGAYKHRLLTVLKITNLSTLTAWIHVQILVVNLSWLPDLGNVLVRPLRHPRASFGK